MVVVQCFAWASSVCNSVSLQYMWRMWMITPLPIYKGTKNWRKHAVVPPPVVIIFLALCVWIAKPSYKYIWVLESAKVRSLPLCSSCCLRVARFCRVHHRHTSVGFLHTSHICLLVGGASPRLLFLGSGGGGVLPIFCTFCSVFCVLFSPASRIFRNDSIRGGAYRGGVRWLHSLELREPSPKRRLIIIVS